MGSLNLYKIESDKRDEFIRMLSSKLEMKNTIECGFGESETNALTLYILNDQKRNDLSWNWVLNGFSQPEIRTVSSPKAVILAEKDDDITYAVTFQFRYIFIIPHCLTKGEHFSIMRSGLSII